MFAGPTKDARYVGPEGRQVIEDQRAADRQFLQTAIDGAKEIRQQGWRQDSIGRPNGRIGDKLGEQFPKHLGIDRAEHHEQPAASNEVQ